MRTTPLSTEGDSSGMVESHSASPHRRWLKVLLLGTAVVLLIASYSNHWLSASSVPIASSRRETLQDFQFAKVGGGQWRLSDHRGQIVLLNFWATWCPPCREETPGLVQLAEQLPSKDVAIVGISMDEDHTAIPGFVQTFHVPYPVLLPAPGSRLAGSVDSLPTSLLLDRNGRVARSYVGAVSEAVFARDIQQLLREGQNPDSTNS